MPIVHYRLPKELYGVDNLGFLLAEKAATEAERESLQKLHVEQDPLVYQKEKRLGTRITVSLNASEKSRLEELAAKAGFPLSEERATLGVRTFSFTASDQALITPILQRVEDYITACNAIDKDSLELLIVVPDSASYRLPKSQVVNCAVLTGKVDCLVPATKEIPAYCRNTQVRCFRIGKYND